MKMLHLVSMLILLFSCTSKNTTSDKKQDKPIKREIVVQEFQTILDSANVKGSILIYNLEDNYYYSNGFEWAKQEVYQLLHSKLPIQL